MSDNILKSFEDACIKVTTNPSYDRTKYLALRADNIQLLTLRPKFKPIAKKYIPHAQKRGVDRFPAEVIVKISNIMGVYVNDITTLGQRKR